MFSISLLIVLIMIINKLLCVYSIYCSPDLVQCSSLTAMEHLANTLRALASSKEVNLLAVAKALGRHANEGDTVAAATK